MTKVFSKGMAAIALSAGLGLTGMSIGVQTASAATIPAVTSVTLTGSGSNQVGGTATLTAQANTTMGAQAEYAFWVQEPSGQWVQARGFSTNGTYTMTGLKPGSYLVVVQSMTPEQIKAGDWSAAMHSQQTVNVDTSVEVTNITGAFTDAATGVTVGQPTTITAQAANITNPVYQFWIEENGHWTGSNYTSNPNYTFTPTVNNFEVAVYAKTVEEPKNAGSGLGTTPAVSITPQLFSLQASRDAARSTLMSIINQGVLRNANGVVTPSMVGAPSPSVVDPHIPSYLPANGSITGASALLASNPSILTQAQGLAQAQHVTTISSQTLVQGMHYAAQALMALGGNDPMSNLNYLTGGVMLNPNNTVVSPQMNNIIDEYNVVTNDNSYSYYQSTTITPSETLSSGTYEINVGSSVNSTYNTGKMFPFRVFHMIVPMTWTEVVSNKTSSGVNVVKINMVAVAKVSLYTDPLVPGGLQWGLTGVNYEQSSSAMTTIYPNS